MNPYSKYLELNYEELSEQQMMGVLNEVFDIDPSTKKGLFDRQKHYAVVEKLIKASFKLNYKTVCNELSKICPLSFPEWEKLYRRFEFQNN